MDGAAIGLGVAGWTIAVASLSFNVYQFLHAKRKRVKAKITMFTKDHARWLIVDVENIGTELHDLNVHLHYVVEKTTFDLPLTPEGDVPNPFKFGYSCRFTLVNEEPSVSVDVLPERTVVVVSSRVLEVARIPAAEWKEALSEFTKANPSLPAKPVPRDREPHPLGGWANSYKGRY